MTLEQVKAERPTLDYDGRYGGTEGPWTPDRFVEAVYRSLSQTAAAPATRPAARSETMKTLSRDHEFGRVSAP